MNKLLTIIIIMLSLSAAGQKDTIVTDSTPVLTIKHIERVMKYLEDKMIAKDYNLVAQAMGAIIQEAIEERKKKKSNK
ncbi:MAG: hypothetical protein JNK14_00035 [Chitinophagaceae bacterium]|nr:hypothetical protein [Chitinophagaceae bacterium]